MGSARSVPSAASKPIPADAALPKEIRRKVVTLFHWCDKDGSQVVSMGEMKRYYKSIKSIGDKDEYRKKAAETFAIFDVSGAKGDDTPDHGITLEEFTSKMAEFWYQDQDGFEKIVDQDLEDFELHRAARKIQKVQRGRAERKKKKKKKKKRRNSKLKHGGPPSAKAAATADPSAGMKLKLAMAHFHPPFQVGGAPKPDGLKKCDEIAQKFAAALGNHGLFAGNEDLLNLFAGGASWTDPVGGPPPYVGTDKLKARISKLPPMDSVELKEVFYSMNPKIFLAKNVITFTEGKKSFVVLDSFELDDTMKIVKLESHFHPPSALKGAPKPPGPEEISQRFGRALFTHGQNEDLINLFAADGVWHDPVGGPPPYVGTDMLKARISKLPPMGSVEVKEVFYSMNPKIFLAKTEVTFKGKKPFIVLDKFVCA